MSLLMSTSVVSDPGRRRSAPVFDEDLDQILRNSRRDIRPPRRSWWGPVACELDPARRPWMMLTDALSWLMWVMVVGLLVLLWASALLLTCAVLPGRPRRARDENEAIGELSLRLARGEISADEFEQRRQRVLDAFRDRPRPSAWKDCTCEENFPPHRDHRKSRRLSADARRMREPHRPHRSRHRPAAFSPGAESRSRRRDPDPHRGADNGGSRREDGLDLGVRREPPRTA